MTASKKPREGIGRQLLAALAKLASQAKGWKRHPGLTTCAIGVQCVAMSKVLRGVITLVLFVAGFSLFLELGERYHWVQSVYIALMSAFLLVGSLVKLWRAVRYGDFKVTSQMFWLPRSWQAWMFPGIFKR